VQLPISVLEKYIFERISIRGRAPVITVELIEAIDGLNRSIEIRNSLAADIQRASLPSKELAEKYFGVQTSKGIRDKKINSNVEALYNQTDDCIFFAKLLSDDLLSYGTRLRNRYRWRYRNLPKLGSADWSVMQAAGLMPDPDLYKGWLTGFKSKRTLWSRIKEGASAKLRAPSFWRKPRE
jgi:hypothetical protein